MSDTYHAAIMTPVLHYTMGGLEIGINAAVHNANGGEVEGLYACGELAGGVHGANRLGGSSLLYVSFFFLPLLRPSTNISLI